MNHSKCLEILRDYKYSRSKNVLNTYSMLYKLFQHDLDEEVYYHRFNKYSLEALLEYFSASNDFTKGLIELFQNDYSRLDDFSVIAFPFHTSDSVRVRFFNHTDASDCFDLIFPEYEMTFFAANESASIVIDAINFGMFGQ